MHAEKKSSGPLLMPVLVLLSALLITAGMSANADASVGFVNIPKIMEEAPQAKAARQKLQREFSSRREELEECGETIKDLDRMLRREGRDMEKSRRERTIDKIRKERRECDDLRTDFETDFNKRRNEELNELQKEITEVIEDIARKGGFKMIVGPPIIYVDDQMNLTEEVLKILSRERR